MGTYDTQAVLKRIVEVLAPYIGETMARSSARAHCDKLGILDGTMRDDQLEALVTKLSAGLKVFLPKEKCMLVVARLRHAVSATRSP